MPDKTPVPPKGKPSGNGQRKTPNESGHKERERQNRENYIKKLREILKKKKGGS